MAEDRDERPKSDVTRFVEAAKRGDERATDRLLVAVYDELRLLAARKLAREPAGQTLQATALVHEAWMRLLCGGDPDWEGRRHFFGAAAEAMRRILVERARRRRRLKHGGDRVRVALGEDVAVEPPPSVDLLALDEALGRLEEADEAKARLVKLRFFAGLGLGEAARLLGISRATADRHWAFARAWLYDALRGDVPPSGDAGAP